MLDIKFIRDNLKKVAQSLKTRGYNFDLEGFKNLDLERKDIQVRLENLQNLRNTKSKQIGVLKKDKQDASELIENVNSIASEISSLKDNLQVNQQNISNILLNMPNLPHYSVNIGQNEADNVEIKKVKTPLNYEFEIKNHLDLINHHSKFNVNIANKLSGSRFALLSSKIANLHRALANYMLDKHLSKGYVECNVPLLVNQNTLTGTGQLPKFSEDLFHILPATEEKQKLCLIPTSEVPLINIVSGEILKDSDLPLKLTAHSQCFRSEAGSYGRDTKGLIRQHQFEKVEMVQIVKAVDSYKALEEMLSDAEEILDDLELPYRVMSLCTKDMGFSAAKTYDLEVWLPSQNCYREISSISNCEDFQARRMKARIKDSDSNMELVHTLNGSGLAVGRSLVALLENHQQQDMSIYIPRVLRKYLGDIEYLV